MHPILFRIGTFEMHSWGVAFVISILLGIWVAVKRARKMGVDPNVVMDLTLVIIIAAVIGSRFWYVVFHISEFKGHWLDTINPIHDGYIGIAGLSMMGGVVFAIISAFLYTVIKKINFTEIADVMAPSFLLGAGFQRIGGCYLNGCCFGKPTDSFLGITFPITSVAGSVFPGVHIWPTQLFASALGFIGFFLILYLDQKRSFSGYTTWLVLAYYSVDRFIVDQFRYYESHQVLGSIGPVTININDLILLALFITSVIMFTIGIKKKNRLKAT
ncbi:hypothetical protein DRQ07_09410 [candidate division KSB1 bacterium]|nr:MAG: hypothetical protein DRQ07_09410 [candidate division KSB1 bacterium]